MRWFATAVMVLASIACASAPVARDFDDLANYRRASFTEVWDVVVDIVGNRNWVIEDLEPDSGTITTPWMSIDDDDDDSFRDCGSSGFRASDSDHMGRVSVVVRETDDVISVRVTTSWRVTRSSARAIGSVECFSTGVLETQLHDEIGRRLR